MSTRGSGGRHRADRLGVTFIAVNVAALLGVDEQESGLAAGLINTSQATGALIGSAIVFAVGIELEAIISDDEPALTISLGRGFWFGAATCLVALVAALVLIRRGARPVEAAPATPAA